MGRKGSTSFPSLAAGVVILILGISLACAGERVSRMSKEELKEMLGKPELVVLDVRSGSDWKKSDQKIQGAVREDPDKPAKTWAEKYPKDKTIVLYCA